MIRMTTVMDGNDLFVTINQGTEKCQFGFEKGVNNERAVESLERFLADNFRQLLEKEEREVRTALLWVQSFEPNFFFQKKLTVTPISYFWYKNKTKGFAVPLEKVKMTWEEVKSNFYSFSFWPRGENGYEIEDDEGKVFFPLGLEISDSDRKILLLPQGRWKEVSLKTYLMSGHFNDSWHQIGEMMDMLYFACPF